MAALTAHQHLNWQSSPQQSMAKTYHTDLTAEPGNEALNSMSQVASRPWADNIELWGGRACIVTFSQGPNELLPTRCQPTETAMDALPRDDLLPPPPSPTGLEISAVLVERLCRFSQTATPTVDQRQKPSTPYLFSESVTQGEHQRHCPPKPPDTRTRGQGPPRGGKDVPGRLPRGESPGKEEL